MVFTWDEIKRQSNIAKHDMDFADLTDEFLLNSTVRSAKRGRFTATGELSEGIVAVVFRPVGS